MNRQYRKINQSFQFCEKKQTLFAWEISTLLLSAVREIPSLCDEDSFLFKGVRRHFHA